MKERPIVFSGPMVRAILDGRKTQTRRVVQGSAKYGVALGLGNTCVIWDECPYGQPGDQLWVRENCWERPERTPKMMREGADTWEPYYYDADGLTESDVEDFRRWGFKRRPSIHMPRLASRITLEIEAVRVERLQDITEEDAKAEGCDASHSDYPNSTKPKRTAFCSLWCSINGPGSWEFNPWVWVIGFRRLEK